MQGRYGPYVSDGVTNASLPRGTGMAEVTFPYAVNLLKERAEAGPSKRTLRKKASAKSTKKAAAPKAAEKKKAAKKTAKGRTQETGMKREKRAASPFSFRTTMFPLPFLSTSVTGYK